MGNPTTESLKQSMRGSLIEQDDPSYAEACKLDNGIIFNSGLSTIARCTDVADVVATVQFAREHGHLLAVRGGGHNGPGLGKSRWRRCDRPRR